MQRLLFAIDVQKDRLRSPLPGYFMSTLLNAWMAAICVGATLGYTSPAAQSIAAATGDAAESLRSLSSSSWFSFLLPLGAILGAVLGGPASQHLGRRLTLLLSALCYMAGYSFIMSANSARFMLIGRFVTGFATGMVSLCAPVYISEVVAATQRGSLGAVFQLAITLGILYSYVLSSFLEWRWLATACFICSVLLVITSQFAIESPRWLLLRGRKLDAILSLQTLRGPDIRVGGTLMAAALMDVVGRRRLLSVSSIICVFALSTIGALYSMSSGEQAATSPIFSFTDRLPVVFIGLYVIGYSIGLGPVVWVLNAELVPCRYLGLYLSVVVAFNWACALAVTLFFTFAYDALRLPGLGLLFSLVTFGGALLMLYFLPETQCLSLEQILQGHFPEQHDEVSAASSTRISSFGRKD